MIDPCAIEWSSPTWRRSNDDQPFAILPEYGVDSFSGSLRNGYNRQMRRSIKLFRQNGGRQMTTAPIRRANESRCRDVCGGMISQKASRSASITRLKRSGSSNQPPASNKPAVRRPWERTPRRRAAFVDSNRGRGRTRISAARLHLIRKRGTPKKTPNRHDIPVFIWDTRAEYASGILWA